MTAGNSSNKMRRGRRFGPAPMAELNIIPLVDVTLVILIIFMVTTTFDKNKSVEDEGKPAKAIPVSLPVAATTVEIAGNEDPLIIGVDAAGQKFVGNTWTSTETFRQAIREAAKTHPDRKVRIDADRATKFESVVEIVELCQLEGLKRIAFHTKNNDGE
jgi:biopolymer transport protein ExbD